MLRPEAVKLTTRLLALAILTVGLLAVLSLNPNRARARTCELTWSDCYQPDHYYYLDEDTCSCRCAQSSGLCEAPGYVDQTSCTCTTGPDVCDSFHEDSCRSTGGTWVEQPENVFCYCAL